MEDLGFEEVRVPESQDTESATRLGGAMLELFNRRHSDGQVAEASFDGAQPNNPRDLSSHIPEPRKYVLNSRRGSLAIKRYLVTGNSVLPIERS